MEAVGCRSVIKFFYLKSRIPKETFNEMKEVYGDDLPSYEVVKRWYRQFKCGRISVKTAPNPGRPYSTSDDDTIHKVGSTFLKDHRITIRQLAQEMKINVGSVEKIIHDHLHMRKLSAR
ncbi:protein GVQW3-like [Octopus bimaculoides]|uniref:protein GVQW3-like n=1 Tax=Octopus bimaculoides TaxID=37653 RepID=UPI00071CDA70|nr:protein GVQW3-like [Octopus bimaculoides]|eukprot:XP_014785636.1 PREDICTED: putative uncharacterized protein FLJ37770 [Octopus bimaculoides]